MFLHSCLIPHVPLPHFPFYCPFSANSNDFNIHVICKLPTLQISQCLQVAAKVSFSASKAAARRWLPSAFLRKRDGSCTARTAGYEVVPDFAAVTESEFLRDPII